ncbi:MAG: hypothetical protein ACE5FC_05885, partial [Myxococcota bacterium]
LKALDTHPAHGEILKEIKQVVAAKHRWNWEEARRRRGQRPPEAEDFILYPPGIEVPEIVFRAAAKEMHPRVFDGCRKRKRCVLLALQLDSDPDLEYAVLPGPYREGILVEITPRGSWRSFPLQHRDYAWKGAADAVRDGDVGVLPSAYKRVRIGDKAWVVMEDLPSAGPQTPRGKPR